MTDHTNTRMQRLGYPAETFLRIPERQLPDVNWH